MALPTIQLDDRNFDQLFAFLRKQIDTTEWVDHNYSDPGIALLELRGDLFEESHHDFRRFALVHAEIFVEQGGEVGFRDGHRGPPWRGSNGCGVPHSSTSGSA